MTWTVNQDSDMIELTPDGSTDFVWTDYFPLQKEGVKIQEIQVYFNAVDDVVQIRTHRTAGATLFKFKTIDGKSVAKRFYEGLFKPVIVNSEQTGTVASWKILIQTA